jgi:hypothetical protein
VAACEEEEGKGGAEAKTGCCCGCCCCCGTGDGGLHVGCASQGAEGAGRCCSLCTTSAAPCPTCTATAAVRRQRAPALPPAPLPVAVPARGLPLLRARRTSAGSTARMHACDSAAPGAGRSSSLRGSAGRVECGCARERGRRWRGDARAPRRRRAEAACCLEVALLPCSAGSSRRSEAAQPGRAPRDAAPVPDRVQPRHGTRPESVGAGPEAALARLGAQPRHATRRPRSLPLRLLSLTRCSTDCGWRASQADASGWRDLPAGLLPRHHRSTQLRP